MLIYYKISFLLVLGGARTLFPESQYQLHGLDEVRMRNAPSDQVRMRNDPLDRVRNAPFQQYPGFYFSMLKPKGNHYSKVILITSIIYVK